MSWYRLQLWSNFSYFLNNPEQGDGIEQNDKRYLLGNNVTYGATIRLAISPRKPCWAFKAGLTTSSSASSTRRNAIA